MINNFKDEIQKLMAERYDAEFTQVMDLIQKSYNKGYEDGKDTTKMQIINMLQGEKQWTITTEKSTWVSMSPYQKQDSDV